ncbi:MAG: type II toxin-antitoxin system CcdA family antitoxin [Actinobacteria bacterium]|nr:type II toxin-antitoxin system CcdA family antitoxin [Actinomycetota bacterium]
MAKRKITVTVDEELVDTVSALGAESLSAVVNEALAHEVERRARAAALGRLVAEWDARYGPVSDEAAAAASAAFDDLDAVAPDVPAAPGRRRRKGAA